MTGESSAPDLWVGLAVLLLVIAMVALCLALFRVGGRWSLLAVGATVGAVIALAVALVVIATTHGHLWQVLLAAQSLDPRLVVLGLALATLVVQLVLAWRLPVDAARLVVDLLVLVLVFTAGFMADVSELPLDCDKRTIPSQLQCVLFLIGTGGLTVAGSTGLTLALRALLSRRIPRVQWPRWIHLHALLKRATALALVSLGAGLVVSLWWSWQMQGVSITRGPREGWVIVALLVAAMSFLARRTGGRWGRWTAGLVMVAAAVAILGLLTGIDLLRYLKA